MPEPVRVRGDLLDQRVDAIVNAWNRNFIPWWLLVPSGVSGAIKRRGGHQPFREVRRHGTLRPGQAVVTSAGRLPHTGACTMRLATRARALATPEDPVSHHRPCTAGARRRWPMPVLCARQHRSVLVGGRARPGVAVGPDLAVARGLEASGTMSRKRPVPRSGAERLPCLGLSRRPVRAQCTARLSERARCSR